MVTPTSQPPQFQQQHPEVVIVNQPRSPSPDEYSVLPIPPHPITIPHNGDNPSNTNPSRHHQHSFTQYQWAHHNHPPNYTATHYHP
jgi:hypothetical protein